MSSQAQIAANQSNARLSTGPKTESGKAAAALNNMRHGLASSVFRVLPIECQFDFDNLFAALRDEHQPATPTETVLVEAMAQHQWLRKRALTLESLCFDASSGQVADPKQLALALRYQTTHERAFHKSLNDLLKLRDEKRKNEIGFESQQRAREEHTRKQENHQMGMERHKLGVVLAEAKADHQHLMNRNQQITKHEREFAAEQASS